MYNLAEYFIKQMDDKGAQVSVRVPTYLAELLTKKYQQVIESDKDLKIKYTDFLRDTLVISVLPEILQHQLLEDSTSWITKAGERGLEQHFGEKIQKLQSIVDSALFAIKETRELQAKAIELEIESLNKISDFISKEMRKQDKK